MTEAILYRFGTNQKKSELLSYFGVETVEHAATRLSNVRNYISVRGIPSFRFASWYMVVNAIAVTSMTCYDLRSELNPNEWRQFINLSKLSIRLFCFIKGIICHWLL